MHWIEKFLELFSFEKAAIVNEDDAALAEEVDIVQRNFPNLTVKGFTNFEQFFFDVHLSKHKKCPYKMAFLKNVDTCAGELVLKKSSPSIQTFKYSDSDDLSNCLSKVR